jgi:hypothetical protein
VLHEKGEVSKERIEKKLEENSQLKSALIQKASELELSDFHIKQKDQQCQTLLEENQDLRKANSALKTRIKEQLNCFDSSESRVKELSREVEQLVQERQKKEEALSQSNFFIMSLQNELEEMGQLGLLVQAKEKECIQLREAKSEAEHYYLNELRKSKELVSDLKKEIKSNRTQL